MMMPHDGRRFASVIFLAAILPWPAIPEARAQNVIERAIASAEPCRSLKADVILTTVGIDVFESVDVHEFLLSAVDDVGKARLVGTLACRTSSGAFQKGQAKAKIAFEAQFDLTTCRTENSQVRILETAGRYGGVIDLFTGSIEAALRTGLERQIGHLCGTAP